MKIGFNLRKYKENIQKNKVNLNLNLNLTKRMNIQHHKKIILQLSIKIPIYREILEKEI